MEDLTIAICDEYEKKGKSLGEGVLVVGKRKSLVQELQKRCGIPELWAINIVNGSGGRDYIAILNHKKKGGSVENEKNKEYLEWLAQKEEQDRIEQIMLKEELDI